MKIKDLFVDINGWPRKEIVPINKIEVWLQSNDIDVRGAIIHFLCDNDKYPKINPRITPYQEFDFISQFFSDCLKASEKESEKWVYASTGFDLCHQIAYWTTDYWKTNIENSHRKN